MTGEYRGHPLDQLDVKIRETKPAWQRRKSSFIRTIGPQKCFGNGKVDDVKL